jgi:hypothetical protein
MNWLLAVAGGFDGKHRVSIGVVGLDAIPMVNTQQALALVSGSAGAFTKRAKESVRIFRFVFVDWH